ncbi:hypothetical protein Tco_0204650 [Tanacetum coccineum]
MCTHSASSSRLVGRIMTVTNTTRRMENEELMLKMIFGDNNPVEESPAPSPTIASLTSGSASTSIQSARGIGEDIKRAIPMQMKQTQFGWLLGQV